MPFRHTHRQTKHRKADNENKTKNYIRKKEGTLLEHVVTGMRCQEKNIRIRSYKKSGRTGTCKKPQQPGGGGDLLHTKNPTLRKLRVKTKKEGKKAELTKTQHGNVDEQLKIHRSSVAYTRYLQQQQKYTKVYESRGELHPERKRGEEGRRGGGVGEVL